MPETSCFPIPAHVSLTQAALSEPLAIGVYAVQRAKLPHGAAVGILGAGPIGLCVATAAQVNGIRCDRMTEPIPERRALALRMGVRSACLPGDLDVSPQLDAVFECCGQQTALDQAVELLKPGGTLIIVGIPEADRVSFSIDRLRRKEITIINVRRQEGCVQSTLNLMARSAINVDSLVTHRFTLEQVASAFELVAGYSDGVVKAMVDIA